MPVEKILIAEKGKYKLFRVGENYEIWNLINFARSGKHWVFESSFTEMDKAYYQFNMLTKNAK